ncbi:hypothetical protein [Bdellovibrio bacteriovorus]|uniref:hypothetical protein n=1 Tax=Bdellovibrio bacteriovorus TaxID=959 RepID=UPI0035A73AD7
MKIFFLSILLLGCSSSLQVRRNLSSVDFDLSLLRPYSEEYAKEENLTSPYVATFKSSEIELNFLAAGHANNIDHPTFKTIKSIIESFAPDFIVLEGFEDNGQISSPAQIAHAEQCNADGFKSCGEPSYAVYLANKKSIPFVSGDPSDSMILPEFHSKNYTTQDLIGLRLIQLIPQWRRAGELNPETTPARLEKRAAWYSEKLKSPEVFTFITLKQWYFDNTGETFDFNKIGSSTVAPTDNAKSTKLNKMSFQTGLMRDSYLLSKIQFGLNRYQKVLVVFGQGHLVKTRKALEKAMGKSEDQKLF